MATPVVETSNSASADAATTLTITKPSGTVDNNLLVALVFTYEGGGANTPADESGWTTIASVARDFIGMKAYYKIASSEGSDYTFDFDSSDSAWGMIFRITGHDSAAPISASDTGVLNSTTATPSIAINVLPALSDALLIMGISSESLGGSTPTASTYIISGSNPTWTEQGEDTESTEHVFAIATATANSAIEITTEGYTITETGQKHIGILISLAEQANVPVTLAVLSLTGAVQEQTITGTANFTLDTLALTGTPNDVTASELTPAWSNKAKSSTSTFTNKSKT